MTNHNWSSIVRSIQISDTKILGTEINWPIVQHAFGCVPIDLRLAISQKTSTTITILWIFLISCFPSSEILASSKKSVKLSRKNDIIIELSKKENFGITIFVEDKNTAASRTILANYQVYTGSRINIPDLDKTWNKHYIFTFNQFQFPDNDPVSSRLLQA